MPTCARITISRLRPVLLKSQVKKTLSAMTRTKKSGKSVKCAPGISHWGACHNAQIAPSTRLAPNAWKLDWSRGRDESRPTTYCTAVDAVGAQGYYAGM